MSHLSFLNWQKLINMFMQLQRNSFRSPLKFHHISCYSIFGIRLNKYSLFKFILNLFSSKEILYITHIHKWLFPRKRLGHGFIAEEIQRQITHKESYSQNILIIIKFTIFVEKRDMVISCLIVI